MANQNFNTSLPPLEPGTVLNGGKYEYKILELTSNRGGFGRIYRAERLGAGTQRINSKNIVAIKEFHAREFEFAEWSRMHSWTRNEKESCIDVLKAKFGQEAKLLFLLGCRLQDKHLPKIIGQTWMENGRLFYAMTFIEGLTLRETMETNGFGYVMPEFKAIDYIIQIAKVLHKAHEMGMTHADVSPNNIMIDKKGNAAVLVDWGNAKSYNDELTKKVIDDNRDTFQRYQDDLDKANERMRQQNYFLDDEEDMMIGTTGYMAPDTFWGTPQSDVYSLAATLFYLLTRKKPDVLDCKSMIGKARDLLRERGISDETTEAIIHAMNVDADKATQSIHEFMMELPKDIVIKILLNYTEFNR